MHRLHRLLRRGAHRHPGVPVTPERLRDLFGRVLNAAGVAILVGCFILCVVMITLLLPQVL